MQTTTSCSLCEKVSVTFKSKRLLTSSLDLPNTYDRHSKKYGWKHYNLMEYALVPRTINKTTGEVDLYVCMDEDEIDDIDLIEYAEELLHKEILPAWDKFSIEKVLPAYLSPPQDIGCRRCEPMQ